MSLACVKNVKNEINSFIGRSELPKDEQTVIELLTYLLDYFYFVTNKCQNTSDNEIEGFDSSHNFYNINEDKKILEIKAKIIDYLEKKNYSPEDFTILELDTFDDCSKFMFSLIKSFLFYFKEYKIEKELKHIYYYIFHLIYYSVAFFFNILYILLKNQELFFKI